MAALTHTRAQRGQATFSLHLPDLYPPDTCYHCVRHEHDRSGGTQADSANQLSINRYGIRQCVQTIRRRLTIRSYQYHSTGSPSFMRSALNNIGLELSA